MMDLNHVSKTFGEKTVVSDVTLPIEKGKMTACIGPNGAGKSTLLEIISRLIPRDSGSVIIDGSEVNSFKQNDLAKRLAFLKQTNRQRTCLFWSISLYQGSVKCQLLGQGQQGIDLPKLKRIKRPIY